MNNCRKAAFLLSFLALLPDLVVAETIFDLRRELEVAPTVEDQLEVIGRMRTMVQRGAAHPGQVGMVVYVVLGKPVIEEPQAMDLFRDMLAKPDLVDGAAGTIASQFYRGGHSEQIYTELATMLKDVSLQRGTPVPRVNELWEAMAADQPLFKRTMALEILTARPPTNDEREEYLKRAAELLDPEFTLSERQTAVRILAEGASTGELPRRTRGHLYRAARDDPDAAIRVSTWPLVMPLETERSSRYHFGADLTEQLAGPATETTPSFDDADVETRERAVHLLNDYWDNWESRYPAIYVDALVSVVVNHGSPAGIETLTELRRRNELTDEHLAALGGIELGNSQVSEAVEVIVQPNLTRGSLVGPLEVLRSGSAAEERATALRLLLDEHPTGPVPMDVATAAYSVMTDNWEYDAAAVSLMARGDEPFASKEDKILALVATVPRPNGTIVEALRQIHDGSDTEGLVVLYASDKRIEETFRASLVNRLYGEVRDSADIEPGTVEAVRAFGLSADNYGSVSVVIRLLEATGANVPMRLWLKDKGVQWTVLLWMGLGSLVVGGCSALAWLGFIALLSRASGARRLASLVGLLAIVSLFVVCAVAGFVLSLGHNSTPNPGPAAPFYVGCAIIALSTAALTIRMYGKRSEAAPDG